ncbi:MAG: hypothetical protein K1Y01_04460 [Vicinamibacteria bacterium]|nr:hypothetical protein [Vicinamibacteria bacterium]
MSAAAEPSFFGLHAAWWTLSILSGLLLWSRPRPRVALAILVVMHAGAYLGYYGNLGRPYGVGVGSDRSLGLGMARAVADGGSPFDHVQIRFGNLEPFWTFSVAALSGFSSERVPFVYDHMALLALTLTALGFYAGWSRRRGEEDADEARWRGVLVAAAVLGLSSMNLGAAPPAPPFWQANFVFKPNHSIAFGLVGLLSGYRARSGKWWGMGLLLGLLLWAFILDWAYLLPGLFIGALMAPARWTELKRVVSATAASAAIGAVYVAHLLRDYNPAGPGDMPLIWRDPMGEKFENPFWWSLDLGPLLLLFLVGLLAAFRNRREDGAAFGFLLTAPLVAAGYLAGLRLGFAPEPDEGYFWVRMAAAAGAGYGVWTLLRWKARGSQAAVGLVFAAMLAFSFPGRFDPTTQDRYYARSLTPLDEDLLSTAAWLRENTSVHDVLMSSEGITLSGLTGRRFLMVRPVQTRDRAEREWTERQILTSMDERAVRQAAARYGVTHVVLDGTMALKYANEDLRGLGNRPWFAPAHVNSFARILILRKP